MGHLQVMCLVVWRLRKKSGVLGEGLYTKVEKMSMVRQTQVWASERHCGPAAEWRLDGKAQGLELGRRLREPSLLAHAQPFALTPPLPKCPTPGPARPCSKHP